MLPLGVIRVAARLGHWVAENAKTTRAFLKRVDAVVPLAQPLQAISIVELPRAAEGRARQPAAFDAAAAARAGAARPRHRACCRRPACRRSPTRAPRRRGGSCLGLEVVALPGASSLLLALAASGLNGQSFAFVGYLPIEPAARAARIRELEALSRRLAQTQLMIETPYRNAALLGGAASSSLQPTTRLSVSCGLTLPAA